MHDAKDYGSKGHMILTTRELQMQEGKDGFVLFSNQKADLLSEISSMGKTVLVVALIFVSLTTGILLCRQHRCRVPE